MNNDKLYSSAYTDKKITAHQLLVEKILAREALHQDGIKKLPWQFWNAPEWSKRFRRQLKPAKALLERFPLETILEAFSHKRSARIFSWGLLSHWAPLCEEIERAKAARNSVSRRDNIPDVGASPTVPRSNFSGDSLRSKLKDL